MREKRWKDVDMEALKIGSQKRALTGSPSPHVMTYVQHGARKLVILDI